MLKLKLGVEAPDGAAVLAYTTGVPLSISENLTLEDQSFYVEENLTGMQGRYQVVDLGATLLADADIVVYDRAVLESHIKSPVPLPYRWQVGTNTALGRAQLFILDQAAAALGLPIGPATGLTQTQKITAEKTLKKNLAILDNEGSEIPDYFFEVELIEVHSVVTASGTVPYFEAYLYTDRQSTSREQFRLRYNAIDANGNIQYNFVEAINSVPYVSYVVLDTSDPIPVFATLAVKLEEDNEILLEEVVAADFTTPMEALGLFTTRANLTYTMAGGVLTFAEGGSPLSGSFDFNANPIKNIVNDINASSLPVEASVMADALNGATLEDGLNVPVVPDYGVSIRLADHVGVYYPNRTKIFARKPPEHSSTLDAWHPLVNTGKFRLNHANGSNLYRVTEYDDQIFSDTYGTDYFDVVAEPPVQPAPRQLQLRHQDVDVNSIRLRLGSSMRNDLIQDYDTVASLLYLSRKLPEHPVSVDYSYTSTDLIYDYLDLNPTSAHQTSSECMYYILYAIPERIERIGLPVETYTRTIYHASASTLQDATDIMISDTLLLGSGRNLYPFVLAVFQVLSDADISTVKVLDIRTRGGGLYGESHADQDESAFYTDIGFVDGEPFPANGPVVLGVPHTVFDELVPALENSPDLVDTRYNAPGGETLESVKGIGLRYLAAGAFPLVKVYKRG